jgi:CheY-like chemotaxis protein
MPRKRALPGCDDYLTQPIVDKLLFQKLERWL